MAIISKTTFSFLGLVDSSQASFHYAFQGDAAGENAYWYYRPPGICVVAVVLSFAFLAMLLMKF